MVSDIVNFKQGKNKLTYKEALDTLDHILEIIERSRTMDALEYSFLFCPLTLGSDLLYKLVGTVVQTELATAKQVYKELQEHIIENPDDWGMQLELLTPLYEALHPLGTSLRNPTGVHIVTPLTNLMLTLSIQTLMVENVPTLFISNIHTDFSSIWGEACHRIFEMNKVEGEEPQCLFYDTFHNRLKEKYK